MNIEQSSTIKNVNSLSPEKELKHTKTEYINHNNNKNTNINQKNLISNDPLFSLKETFICVFCGGKNCKHEDYRNHKNPAIEGLNSDKIDDNIYASQRPSNSLIKEFNLISKFKELNIGFIVNLQLPGEHPYCGPIDKLDESGFSYSPSLFESEGIKVGLFGWKDMNIPNSLNHMLEIVKAMYYYIHCEKKKVLVHCHAGYGRTGITIACYKIFDECITAEIAKMEIRKIRPKCIQSKDQLAYCINFQEFIRRLKGNFYLKEKRTIENFIKYQNDLNTGKYIFRNFVYNKSVPLFLIYLFDAIIDIKQKNNIDDYSLYKCLNGSIKMDENGNELINTITSSINKYNWDILYTCEDPIILCELLYQWIHNSIDYVIDPKNISKINSDLSNYQQILKTCELQTLLLINKFLFLIKSSTEEETEIEKNNFIKILSKYLLGYSNENELKKYEMENTENLSKIINFIEEKEKNLNINLKFEVEDNKDVLLSNVYEELKQYFENKKVNGDNKQMNIVNYMNRENLYNSINNLINNNKIKQNKISYEDIVSDKKKNIKDSLNKEYSSKKVFKVSRLGIVTSNNKNRYNNLTKSLRANLTIKESKNILLTSYKVVDEVEEEKDVPWIREEDC